MREKLASIGKRLKDSRINCGFTQKAAANAVGITRTAVVNIESGKRSISTLELSRFAKLYHRPETYFFETDHEISVESLDLVLAKQIPGYQENSLVKDAVAWLSELCRIGIELETLLGRKPKTSAPTYDLSAPQRTEEAIEQGFFAGEEERRRLGLGFAPIANVLDLISTQGIWASAVELPHEMSGLFLRHASIRSIILVNDNHATSRKRFSFAHEYAHAVLDRNMDAIASTSNNSHELIEKRANAFAAAFLMPQDGVYWFLGILDKGRASRMHLHVYDVAGEEEFDCERRSAPGSQRITFKDVAILARHFGTGYESAVYRLRDLRLIKPSERQSLLKDDQAKAGRDFIALFYQEAAPRPDNDLSCEVANLAIEAFCREEVSSGWIRDLGEKLKIPGAELLRLAEIASC